MIGPARHVFPVPLVLLSLVLPLGAQMHDGDDVTPAPLALARERTGELAIDGLLDDPAWQDASPITRFVQREPQEGAPPGERTEVRVLYDDDALYVAARLYDQRPERIGDQLVRRDEWGAYDFFEVALDPDSDRRTGYQFRVSAAGVQRDVYLYDDTEEDEAWDAVWASAVSRDSLGWTAELRIPLSQLRYRSADSVQSWGVNFTRRRVAGNETVDFALESRLSHGRVSLFGELQGLYLPNAARRMEFRPFALTSARLGPVEPGDPFFNGSEIAPRTGIDARIGLGSAFSLDATIAPDFGQVEVDPAVINLSAFETFFPEKRPFFVEDAQIFDFTMSGRQNRLFYSRRVGREPQGSAPDEADFEDIPGQTTILGAAKVTGRTSGGLSLGGLAALTRRETGRTFNAAAGEYAEFTAEPRTVYAVGRARQDLRDGATQVGGIVTATHRDLPADGSFDFLTAGAYSAGVDFEHNWGGPRSRDWAVWGFAAASLVRGAPEALVRIQRASNHYFQRPDATRFAVDSSATMLSGYEWRLQVGRRSAEHWTGSAWLAEVTPGMEINDLGFSTSGERLDAGARLEYQEITPGSLFRSYRVSAFTFQNWRHEALDDPFSPSSWARAHKRGSFNLNAEVEFLNYWGVNLEARVSPTSQSDVATRGGPLMVDPGSVQLQLRGNTDRRAALSVEPSLNYQHREHGGYQWSTELDISVRPSPRIQLELAPSYRRELNPGQYVTTIDDAGYAPTYGARYLFADLRRQDLSMETRVNVAVSPTLTAQLYAQPLLSSGDYLTYKQLVRPESFAFDRFGSDRTYVDVDDERHVDVDADGLADFSFAERDFNIRSLRLNAVLRWEYRPGSTLFLVWQQGRRSRDVTGTFDLARDVRALWGASPENIFIVKVNYWFGL